MKIEVKELRENPLLHRKEIHLVLSDFTGTPSRGEVVSGIAKELKTKEELIFIGGIKQGYGRTEALCYAEIYETPDDKAKYKTGPRKEGAAKKEEKPAEKTKEEKEPEESKEAE